MLESFLRSALEVLLAVSKHIVALVVTFVIMIITFVVMEVIVAKYHEWKSARQS